MKYLAVRSHKMNYFFIPPE